MLGGCDYINCLLLFFAIFVASYIELFFLFEIIYYAMFDAWISHLNNVKFNLYVFSDYSVNNCCNISCLNFKLLANKENPENLV